MDISKLEIIPLRQAFRHEAHNFTVWLEGNIDALSERINLRLNVLEREKLVGSFHVDLYCEDDAGNIVIIENQLEQTDHDHLGKLLTYMVNLEAKVAIWIVANVRQEHLRVIDWLNESTATDTHFYLIQVEAIRIGNSAYAPLFTVRAGPDAQTKEIGETKKEWAERHILRQQFWAKLLERSRDRTNLGANRSPSRDYWLAVSLGRSGFNYNYLIYGDHAAIDLYIDVGYQEKNKSIFDRLYAEKDAIESEFGDALEWRRLDDKRTSRIVKSYHGYGGLHERDKWENLQDILIDALIRFDKTMRKRVRNME